MPPDPGVTLTKGQLQRALEMVKGTDLMSVTLQRVMVDGQQGVLLSYAEGDFFGEIEHKLLVIGEGVVEL